jgi:hypothetical protein
MDRYIGLDAHASSCTLGVMTPSGKRIGSHVVETNARCLIEAVRQIPSRGTSAWRKARCRSGCTRCCRPTPEKVVVAAVSESRGPKDDRRDAFGLAEDLRLGAIRRKVYKERGGSEPWATGPRGTGGFGAMGAGEEPTEEPVPLAGGAGSRARRLHGIEARGVPGPTSEAGPPWPSSCTRNWTRWRR